MRVLNEAIVPKQNMALGFNSAECIIEHQLYYDLTFSITDLAPANQTFTYTSGNTVTSTAHGYLTGLAVQLTTTGSLPTGLATLTTYYLIVVDANTLSFATSAANAAAGNAIALSGSASGTNTIVPNALAGSVKVQKNNENTESMANGNTPVWVDVAAATTFSTGATTLNFTHPTAFAGFHSLRVVTAITGGMATFYGRLNAKGF